MGAVPSAMIRNARPLTSAMRSKTSFGAFSNVAFAITDWSPERRFLRPFLDVFLERRITAADMLCGDVGR